MPSFSGLFTELTGAGFYYEKSPRGASYTFSQEARSLYRNQPRFPFEYYVAFNLNNVGTAKEFISKYFNGVDFAQVAPLVKSVEMPSMKIETTPLNQYNRKRLSQTKIGFEPVKMVLHDVADGKTLKFWDMYYRYYFMDGSEPGANDPKRTQQGNKTFSVESLVKSLTPSLNPSIASLPASVKNLFQGKSTTGKDLPTNTSGSKSLINNIISDTLDNHNFGFNLPAVGNIRNLIQTIDIFQVHGGRFNQVTLVNPRIAAFTHDILNYAADDKTLELTFSIEYEYAYYTIQNMKLGGSEENNDSSLEPFSHAEFLELPALAFNSVLDDFLESNNPLLQSDNPILQRIGKNVQSTITSATGAAISKGVRKVSASVLDGMANISPTPYHAPAAPVVQARPFGSSAAKSSTKYTDVNRSGGTSG
jgi:hypothetical protein